MMLPNVYTAKSYGLFVDGLDVLKEPATPARYAVPIDSISVTEAGPGGVSSMRFAIDDPSIVVTIADGAQIRYWDLTNNRPIFVGWVESVSTRPDFGQQGRIIEIGAYGIEARLDMTIVPDMTFGNVLNGGDSQLIMSDGRFLQVIAGLTGLNQAMAPDASPLSALATPVSANKRSSTSGISSALVISGQSVRQAWDSFWAIAINQLETGDPIQETLWKVRAPLFLSVDFWGGVRFFAWGGAIGTAEIPSDYASLTLTDTPTGTTAAENLTWIQDTSPNALTNAVYVKGAAAASTGWVVGDSTTGRHEAYATTTGTTAGAMFAAAAPLLGSRNTPAGRGDLDLTSYTPTNLHPGSLLTITDARLGFSAKTFLITEIRKTFNGNGTEDWHLSFVDSLDAPTAGGPSAMRLTRSLTRAAQN